MKKRKDAGDYWLLFILQCLLIADVVIGVYIIFLLANYVLNGVRPW